LGVIVRNFNPNIIFWKHPAGEPDWFPSVAKNWGMASRGGRKFCRWSKVILVSKKNNMQISIKIVTVLENIFS